VDRPVAVLNIFYNGTSGRELSEAYFLAWEMGLKTTYYLRTLGASQVEKSTMSLGGIRLDPYPRHAHAALHEAVASAVGRRAGNGHGTVQAAPMTAESHTETIVAAIEDPQLG
jgi:ribonucleotide reductase alpha subunit